MSRTTSKPMPLRLYLICHGETEWSRSGQDTGRTDLPLAALGPTPRIEPDLAEWDNKWGNTGAPETFLPATYLLLDVPFRSPQR